MDLPIRPVTQAHCEIVMSHGLELGFRPHSRYLVECIKPDGKLRWREDVPNIVVNQGLDHVLAVITTTGFVTNWFVAPAATAFTIAAADVATTAGVRAQFTAAYSEAVLQTYVAGAIAAQSVDNSASKASFSINAATTLGGVFLLDSNNKTTPAEGAILFGGAAFSADRAVQSGDTLNIQITIGAEVT